MDRHRGDRGGERQRGPSRWSDGPPANQRHPSRGGGDGGFDDGGRHHPYRGGGGGGRGRGEPDFSMAGGGPYGGGRHNWYRGGGAPHDYPLSGGRGFDGGRGRHHPYRGGGGDGPPDFPFGGGGGGFAGPPFRHGAGIPVGQGQHFPVGGPQRHSGGFSPNFRGGSPDNVESSNFAKLFIGSVPRTVTEEDVRPLFEEHGNVVEVALIKDRRTGQQQGCCFVKYATLEEADRAIRALHNQATLPGGIGPIQVRYADGERERHGAVEFKLFVGSLNKLASENEIREIFAPYGHVEDVYIMKDDMKQSRGCGFVKFSDRNMASAAIDALNGKYTMRGCDQPLTVRFADPKKPRPGESRGGPSVGSPGFGPRNQLPSSPGSWHPPSPQSRGPFDSDMPFKGFNPSMAQIPLMSQQAPPFQKQASSPKDLQSPYSSQAPIGQQMGHMQAHRPVGGPSSLTQSLPGQPLGSQMPTSQPFAQSLTMHASTQQPLTSPSALPQMMQQPQSQSFQPMFQTSQQSFSQLQPHLPQLHPSQVSKQQTAWGSSPVQQPVSAGPSMTAAPAVPVVPVTCNWTEHTSPEGYKYYYNSMTKESKWEKPEELSLFEQQQKLQSVQNTAVSQVQMQARTQFPQVSQMLQPSKQQTDQLQQTQGQMQTRQQPNILHYQSPGAVSTQIPQDMGYGHHQQARGPLDASRIQQGLQAAQEWMWKNNPAGA